MTKDILELEAWLDSKWRLRMLGGKRRRKLLHAILDDWREQGIGSSDRKMAERVAETMGLSPGMWVFIIQMIAKLIIWWIERKGGEKMAWAAANTMLNEET